MSDIDKPNSTETVPSVISGDKSTRSVHWLPGMVIAGLYWLVVKSVELLAESNVVIFMTTFISPMVTAVLFLLAWLGFSRRPWNERIWGLVLFIGTAAAARGLVHRSMVYGLILYALPVVITTWAIWGWATRSVASLGLRRITLAVTMALSWSYFCLLRLDGLDGGMQSTCHWRWTPTAEERFLAKVSRKTEESSSTSETVNIEIVAMPGDWLGFRGPQRDGVVSGIRIETDWATNPPKLVWKQPIGPGWSSFAVVGGRVFTQEQRGEDECVTCYDAATGAELWCHRDATRFSEPVAGAGPRGTPQFDEGKLFAQGANGHLICLDAATGKRLWLADPAADSKAPTPIWGFSGSPLVADGIVSVLPGGPNGASVLGYRLEDGQLAWKAGDGTAGYCSVHLAELFGTPLLIALTNQGVTALEPASGRSVWKHGWVSEQEIRIAQPMLIEKSRLLIPTGQSLGARLIDVTRNEEQWKTSERWTSKEFKPYFSDYVQHASYAYGFDNLFCCINLTNGKRTWKKGRYGSGQVLLLAEQGLLLVLSETGEVVLLEANPKSHIELAKFPAIEGKTWNHPALVGDLLFVRNGEQIACYRLPLRSMDEKNNPL
ncbi:MAG: PQQ-like beta-propeller repeat protein [Planctomycetia bacterium]|nr:PQQ-like beta-propeller repeat protein [Planctomycetia bacterium]